MLFVLDAFLKVNSVVNSLLFSVSLLLDGKN